MKLKFLYILFLLVFVACGQNVKSSNDATENDTITNFREFEDKTIFEGDTLNGKIKTIIQNYYGEYSNGEDIIYTFDEYGLQIRRQGMGQDIFEYYKFNKSIKSEIYYEGTGELGRTNESVYDKNKNLIKHISKIIPMKNSSSDFNYFVTYYKYDKNNKLIETREGEKRKMFKEKITETIKYQYNENGDCVIEEEYEGKSLIKKKEHKYENHKLIETISWQWFEGFGYYTKKIYKYNEDGTIKFIIHNSSETKEFSEKNNETTFYHYIYDNNNRLIEFQEIYKGYIPYKKTITYSDFDNKGNWQLKITNDNGRKEKVKRRFVYFED